MITTTLIAMLAAYMTPCLAEPPATNYLPSSYSTTMSQHSFAPPALNLGLTAPAAFYSAPTPTYGPPKPVYVTPKPVYSPPPVKTYLPAAPAPFRLSTNYGAPSSTYGVPSQHEDYHSEPAHYQYHYEVHDPHYGTDFGHKEERQGDVTHGRYMVLLPDGRRQIVEYVADKNGYRPTIRYEGHATSHIGVGLSGGYP